jgi:hypothetical protein
VEEQRLVVGDEVLVEAERACRDVDGRMDAIDVGGDLVDASGERGGHEGGGEAEKGEPRKP